MNVLYDKTKNKLIAFASLSMTEPTVSVSLRPLILRSTLLPRTQKNKKNPSEYKFRSNNIQD